MQVKQKTDISEKTKKEDGISFSLQNSKIWIIAAWKLEACVVPFLSFHPKEEWESMDLILSSCVYAITIDPQEPTNNGGFDCSSCSSIELTLNISDKTSATNLCWVLDLL